MGLFDGIKKALYDEVPEAPAKPAATVTPLVTNNNVSAYPSATPQSMPTNMFAPADINKKNANIDSNTKLVADKKLAMQKLAEEIQQLENETETIKSKISTKTYLYNSFASHYKCCMKEALALNSNSMIMY